MNWKCWIILAILAWMAPDAISQNGSLKGKIYDSLTKETLIGAYVYVSTDKGTQTDYDGNYSLDLEYGTYSVKFSYVGYKEITREVVIDKSVVVLDIKLETEILSEVEVVADVARERETPVAFTNVLPAQIEEELASQDIPMILNSTPGVYATQQGGGDGDARVTIRGFSQRNVAVMIDGIPVNDMENGWVYWSNWFGLDAVTQSIQVQRGLGASKIALPSVGGTMNIITKGIDAKKGVKLKQEVGSYGFYRTTLGLTSGRLKNGWGITAAGSFKKGDGYVKENFTKGWFYYLKVQKEMGKHLLSISAMGAPQEHGQRSFKNRIGVFDQKFGTDNEVPDSLLQSMNEYGLNYNEHWGTYNENEYVSNGSQITDTITGNEVTVRERINYYHKPQFALRDFWSVSEKLYVSNIVYLSIGNGGGTGLNSTSGVDITPEGQIDFQGIYDGNQLFEFGPGGLNLDEDGERKSSKFIRSSINNHFWYGYLGSLTYRKDENWTYSGGLDFRMYKGEHYREVYDLLGGDYVLDDENKNQRADTKIRDGEKYAYHDDGHVMWTGGFLQAEYKNELLSAFVNVSAAQSRYRAVDYFREKVIDLGDTLLAVGYLDTVEYAGQTYHRNSAGLETYETDWVNLFGFTVKGGANYNINEFFNAFVNLGYLSRATRFDNVISRSNDILDDYENEIINGYEVGLSFANRKFATNVNGYYTQWQNRPVNQFIPQQNPFGEEEEVGVWVKDMDALHMGVEWDAAYKATANLVIEGIVSIGDWTWQSKESGTLVNEDDEEIVNPETGEVFVKEFDPRGVHVGNSAQLQYGMSFRYEPIKNLYIKGRGTYFGKHFAEFNPGDLVGDNAGRESWRTPDYYVIDFHLGYKRKVGGVILDLRGSVFNLLDHIYISDAQNNDEFLSPPLRNYDAASAGVFFGPPRRFNLSLTIII
jgi:hypothetical protein